MTRTPSKGELVITGQATAQYGTFRVGIANGEGGTIFGGTCEAHITTGYGGTEPPEFEVSIGGIGQHDTTLGRARAAAYLRACDIADEMQEDFSGDVAKTFQVVAQQHSLGYSLHVRDGVTVAVFIEEEN